VHQGCKWQKSILKSNGFIQVHNGGGWSSLEQIIMNVQHLVSDWHFMRFVRLALGTYIGIQAYQTQSILSALLAGFIIPSPNKFWMLCNQ
jgi:hypothetical protein